MPWFASRRTSKRPKVLAGWLRVQVQESTGEARLGNAEDTKIVHVDSEGKLWPSAKGTTKVRAVCDDHEAVLTVSVE